MWKKRAGLKEKKNQGQGKGMHTKWPSITRDRRNLQNLHVREVIKQTREK